jgi:hypothetical protein
MAALAALTGTANPSLALGRNGATNPVISVDCSVSSQATGIKLTGRAAGAGADIAVISSGTNENLVIDAKGSGTVTINGTGTGAITLARNSAITGTLTGTSTSAAALAVGANGATNPVLSVNANTASVATGITVIGAAAAAGVNLAAISSGTNENLTINAKGSGTITLNPVGTGNVVSSRAFVGSLGITSIGDTAGVGYGTGAGGTVTQSTNKSTGVTLNKVTGTVTMNNAALAAATTVGFVLTNSAIAATDLVIVNIKSGATANSYSVTVGAVSAGSCRIEVRNVSAGELSEALVLSFAVIKGVAA